MPVLALNQAAVEGMFTLREANSYVQDWHLMPQYIFARCVTVGRLAPLARTVMGTSQGRFRA
jgi:hypothetical protein